MCPHCCHGHYEFLLSEYEPASVPSLHLLGWLGVSPPETLFEEKQIEKFTHQDHEHLGILFFDIILVCAIGYPIVRLFTYVGYLVYVPSSSKFKARNYLLLRLRHILPWFPSYLGNTHNIKHYK